MSTDKLSLTITAAKRLSEAWMRLHMLIWYMSICAVMAARKARPLCNGDAAPR